MAIIDSRVSQTAEPISKFSRRLSLSKPAGRRRLIASAYWVIRSKRHLSLVPGMRLFSLIIVIFTIFGKVRTQINASSDLNCDFSKECRWGNSSDDNGEWALSNKVQIDQSHSIMSMTDNSEALFAYTHGFMGRTTAILVSDVVSCQLGGANLKYWYYKTGIASQLEICVRQPPGSKETANLRCYDGISSTHAQQWIFRIIELPPSSQPFEILFRSTFYPPTDVIALDDIVFDAALCEISNDGANQGAGGGFADGPVLPTLSPRREESSVRLTQLSLDSPHRPLNFAAPIAVETAPAAVRIGPQFTPMCPPVDCNFDDSTLCNYITSNFSTAREDLREWRTSSKGILNSLTGIPSDLSKGKIEFWPSLSNISVGYFVFAGGERVKPTDTFILSTKTPFSIKEDAVLDFFVYQAGFKGRLSVCANTVHDCELVLDGSNIGNNARQWQNHQLTVNPDVHAVHFVADQLHNNYAIGIDNIQLLNKFRTIALSCS